mmetsp:Transcript_13134/g.41430  ORF Transcript_13134/g.41430 Transcript_13134/m.41430 type:complete len:304 (-) Transcript_13134:409-1320(-)
MGPPTGEPAPSPAAVRVGAARPRSSGVRKSTAGASMALGTASCSAPCGLSGVGRAQPSDPGAEAHPSLRLAGSRADDGGLDASTDAPPRGTAGTDLALAAAEAAATLCARVAVWMSPSLCKCSVSACCRRWQVCLIPGARQLTSVPNWNFSAVMPVPRAPMASDISAPALLSPSSTRLESARRSFAASTSLLSCSFSDSTALVALTVSCRWERKARQSALRSFMALCCFSSSLSHILASTSHSAASATKARSSSCRASRERPSSSCAPPAAWKAGGRGCPDPPTAAPLSTAGELCASAKRSAA